MKVAITEQYLYDIANAIRAKNGSTDLYKPTEMAQAIRDLCQEEGGVVVDGIIQDSWETIIASTQNGKYRDWYQIGDMKPLDLGTEGIVNMQIVAFDADELADGTGGQGLCETPLVQPLLRLPDPGRKKIYQRDEGRRQFLLYDSGHGLR